MSNYQKRIDKVLTYIDANLKEKQKLEKLAEIANLSQFHFHRIMKAYLDEPLGSYINRIRLETAIKLLRYSLEPIKEVSYHIGYDTLSGFNKGFKKMFGVSPTYVREHTNLIVNQGKTPLKNEFQLLESIKTLKDFQVIFQQCKTENQPIKENWNTLFTSAQKHQIINPETKFYGINWDDPEITSKEKIRYDACISIQNTQSINSKFSIKTIIGGKHLCFLYKGDYHNLNLVYNHIFKDWILKRNYNLREAPIFEQYINNEEITPKEDLLTEIFIPIK